MAVVNEIYNDRTKDILYAILLKLGGTMADVEQKYLSNSDDLLYAILKVLDAGIGPGPGPTGPAYLQIVSANFANATDYNNAAIPGNTVAIFSNDLNRFLKPAEFSLTVTGIRILLVPFDATANAYSFVIFLTPAP